MARVFAIRVQYDLRAGSFAVQTLVRPVLSHHAEICSKTLAQYRGTNLIGATFESTVQKFAGVQMSVSGFGPISICQAGRSKSKNRDKQLTFIVRVIGRILIFYLR